MKKSENPYAPYPEWFGEKYGEKLEKLEDPYLRERCVENIETYKQNRESVEERTCPNCNIIYFAKVKSRDPCPFCKAPYKFNVERVMRWFMK